MGLIYLSSSFEEIETCHIPVLLNEVVEAFAPVVQNKNVQVSLGQNNSGQNSSGLTFLDCTLGGGGHTGELLKVYKDLKMVALDRDIRAIDRTGKRLEKFLGSRLQIKHSCFSSVADLNDVSCFKFDGVLADLGVSTDQLNEKRGFSFKDINSLDMRMDESSERTASELVNSASFGELEKVLKIGGVGREARNIVRGVINSRPILNAKQLADVVKQSTPAAKLFNSKTHPATVVFQAIRIWVNREFDEIESLLNFAPKLINKGGRLVIISFHSLEDKLVARRMRKWQSRDVPPPSLPGSHKVEESLGKLLSSKAIVPKDDEVKRNPASRSARMRVFEFI